MITHEQNISIGGKVRSRQTLALAGLIAATTGSPPPGAGAVSDGLLRQAGAVYWAFLRRFGRPLLRVAERPDGSVDIFALGVLLLGFQPPILVDGALRYPIGRGAAVDPRHAGEGYLEMGITPTAVSLTVEGYYPNLLRLHRRIYEWTQAAIHLRVARGYLPLLAEVVLDAGVSTKVPPGGSRR